MLKIKDDVKLSKLKKYGFERCTRKFKYRWSSCGGEYFWLDNSAFDIIVRNNRTLEFSFGLEFNGTDEQYNYINSNVWSEDEYAVSEYMELLYDLIKANLVEKVGD